MLEENKYIIDPQGDLSHASFSIVMATLIHNGFNLCEPITMVQESTGIGNIILQQIKDLIEKFCKNRKITI